MIIHAEQVGPPVESSVIAKRIDAVLARMAMTTNTSYSYITNMVGTAKKYANKNCAVYVLCDFDVDANGETVSDRLRVAGKLVTKQDVATVARHCIDNASSLLASLLEGATMPTIAYEQIADNARNHDSFVRQNASLNQLANVIFTQIKCNCWIPSRRDAWLAKCA